VSCPLHEVLAVCFDAPISACTFCTFTCTMHSWFEQQGHVTWPPAQGQSLSFSQLQAPSYCSKVPKLGDH
jgi:hypothetical protein